MKEQTNKAILTTKRQRHLRNNMTDAERALWQHLRGRQMRGFKFRRQHPYGDYILDFVSLDAMLVIEVDGGQHQSSAAYDCVRTQFLHAAGFRVLRFWNNQVLKEIGAVKERIWNALPTHPHPDLPPEGEGEGRGGR